jgi:hypothetical protein
MNPMRCYLSYVGTSEPAPSRGLTRSASGDNLPASITVRLVSRNGDVTATGTDHNAAWPVPELAENEREGARTEDYRFTVEHTEKKANPTTYSLAESDWMQINVGDQLFITSKRTGSNPYISDEKGNKLAEIRQVK